MPFACFVLSTGRCGTQSLARVFSLAAGDRAVVEHEPLEGEYVPRKALAWSRQPDPAPESIPLAVAEHLDDIESILARQSYVECGHPSWSTIPYLLRHFAGRVRVIHLIRHPAAVAFSWVTHRAYRPPLESHFPERVLLTPFDAGVLHPEYQSRWNNLSPHEKALYYWLEVNAFGVALQRKAHVPWLTVRFEDFVTGAANHDLAQFLDLDEFRGAPPHVDRHRFRSEVPWDEVGITEHPAVAALAERFGYDLDSIDRESLRDRYLGSTRS